MQCNGTSPTVFFTIPMWPLLHETLHRTEGDFFCQCVLDWPGCRQWGLLSVPSELFLPAFSRHQFIEQAERVLVYGHQHSQLACNFFHRFIGEPLSGSAPHFQGCVLTLGVPTSFHRAKAASRASLPYRKNDIRIHLSVKHFSVEGHLMFVERPGVWTPALATCM